MASFIVSSDNSAPQSLAAGESGIVTEGATLFTAAASSVAFTGNATLTALGNIVANANFAAVTMTSAVLSARITVGQNGSLIGTTVAAISGTPADQFILNNAGFISGGSAGISLTSSALAGTIADHHITNSGVIQATPTSSAAPVIKITTPGDGVVTIGNSGEILNGGSGSGIQVTGARLVLWNTGTIAAAPGQSAITSSAQNDQFENSGNISGDIQASTGNDTLRNTGLIQGSVFLGDGVDALRNHGTITGQVSMTNVEVAGPSANDTLVNTGLIEGAVSLGAGDDIFTNRGGQVLGAITGGSGNDTYNIDNASLLIVDSEGFLDVVNASCSMVVPVGIEALNLLGPVGLTGVGNTANNRIEGTGGDDTIRGGEGSDSLFGRDGDNRLFGGAGGDFLVLAGETDFARAGDGGDTIAVVKGGGTIEGGEGVDQITFVLGVGIAADVSLATGTVSGPGLSAWTISGIEDVQGSTGNDTITGTGGVNTLDGREGNDVIRGGGGDDSIIGLTGVDTLTGGAGADNFRFFDVAESGTGAAADLITDFNAAFDTIDFGNIDADPATVIADDFAFIGSGAFSGTAGEVRVTTDAGSSTTLIEVRLAGSVANDMEIVLTGVLTLTAGNFFL